MTFKLGVQCSTFATAYQIIAINVDEFDQICKWLLGFKVSLRGMKVPFTSNYETMLYSKFTLKQKNILQITAILWVGIYCAYIFKPHTFSR